MSGNDDVECLRRRDPAALAAVVERYHHRLHRYLYRLVREPAAADDLFQQTWLNVVRQIARYDPRRSFDTWLFAVAHNVAIDFLRQKRSESLEEHEFEASAAAPAAAPADSLSTLLAAERAAILAAEVQQLPVLYREALALRFEEGMKLEEMAEVTHAPLSTVKSRVQRALESLRTRMNTRWRKEDLL